MKQAIRNTTLADRLLFLILLIGSVAGIFLAREAVSQVPDVIIEIDGKPSYTFPVAVNRTVQVRAPRGNAIIEILDRKVRIKEADCPNRICVKEGWISKGVIVCLPSRIVVFVGGSTHRNGKEIDAITG